MPPAPEKRAPNPVKIKLKRKGMPREACDRLATIRFWQCNMDRKKWWRGVSGKRAVFQADDQAYEERQASTFRRTWVEALEDLLAKPGVKCLVDQDDVSRVIADFAAGPQPVRTLPVLVYHQIFGLFKDGKPMPDLFKKSEHAWHEHARQNGATHKRWDVDEIDQLVRKHLSPEQFEHYEKVRYPIMRADIARFVVLFACGGLYADLDTFPMRSKFEQVSFGCARMPNRTGSKFVPEMEVIVATAGNPILMEFVDLTPYSS